MYVYLPTAGTLHGVISRKNVTTDYTGLLFGGNYSPRIKGIFSKIAFLPIPAAQTLTLP
jgi:hypothetical protein